MGLVSTVLYEPVPGVMLRLLLLPATVNLGLHMADVGLMFYIDFAAPGQGKPYCLAGGKSTDT
eukprot:357677-Chlamydomonas_euryale.AAC.3